MPPVYVHGLYLDRSDITPGMWDLCGIYSSHTKALEALERMPFEREDYAIDPIIVDVDLKD
jgi:hypothetical protein